MPRTIETCKKLKRILEGITSAVLELDSSEGNISYIRNDLEKLDYEVYCEIKNEQQNLYHIYIKKSSI